MIQSVVQNRELCSHRRPRRGEGMVMIMTLQWLRTQLPCNLHTTVTLLSCKCTNCTVHNTVSPNTKNYTNSIVKQSFLSSSLSPSLWAAATRPWNLCASFCLLCLLCFWSRDEFTIFFFQQSFFLASLPS